MFYIITQFPNYLFLLVFPEQKLSIQATLKGRLKMSVLPDKTYCTVYYTVPFLCCNQLKLIDIPAATNSSKA
jgi:hypothetical protein